MDLSSVHEALSRILRECGVRDTSSLYVVLNDGGTFSPLVGSSVLFDGMDGFAAYDLATILANVSKETLEKARVPLDNIDTEVLEDITDA